MRLATWLALPVELQHGQLEVPAAALVLVVASRALTGAPAKDDKSKDTTKEATKEDGCGGDGQPPCGTFFEIVTLKGKLPFIPGIILTGVVLLLLLFLFYLLISWCCRTAASVQKEEAEDELHEVWVLEKGKK